MVIYWDSRRVIGGCPFLRQRYKASTLLITGIENPEDRGDRPSGSDCVNRGSFYLPLYEAFCSEQLHKNRGHRRSNRGQILIHGRL